MKKIKKYLRIHGGELNSRKVFFYQRQSLRPLTGRWRQVISDKFNNLEGMTVADLFSGSGIWGISMLSNGAKHVSFFEKDKLSRSAISENLINLKVDKSKYSLNPGSLPNSLEGVGLKFDFVCCDPPFTDLDLGERVLNSCIEISHEGTVIAFRWPVKRPLPKLYNLHLVRKIEHGNEGLVFLKLDDA